MTVQCIGSVRKMVKEGRKWCTGTSYCPVTSYLLKSHQHRLLSPKKTLQRLQRGRSDLRVNNNRSSSQRTTTRQKTTTTALTSGTSGPFQGVDRGRSISTLWQSLSSLHQVFTSETLNLIWRRQRVESLRLAVQLQPKANVTLGDSDHRDGDSDHLY